MSDHAIIDTGHLRGDHTRDAGCAVCGLCEALCAKHPACSKAAEGRYSIAAHDQKSVARRRKAKRRAKA